MQGRVIQIHALRNYVEREEYGKNSIQGKMSMVAQISYSESPTALEMEVQRGELRSQDGVIWPGETSTNFLTFGSLRPSFFTPDVTSNTVLNLRLTLSDK